MAEHVKLIIRGKDGDGNPVDAETTMSAATALRVGVGLLSAAEAPHHQRAGPYVVQINCWGRWEADAMPDDLRDLDV